MKLQITYILPERSVTNMKALLLKDIKVLAVNMKLYFVLILLYILLGAFVTDLGIFQLYPILLFSLFPVTALAYDERCHWNQYGITLPVSRRDLVLSKYILGIAGSFSIALFTLAVNLVFPILFQNTVTDFRLLSCYILAVVSASILSMDLILPISFHFGTERGRMFYLGAVVLLCAGPAILDSIFDSMRLPAVTPGSILFSGLGMAACAFALLALLLTVFSMAVCIRLFDKKELA